MRRFLSSLIVSIIFMFVGMVSVNADASSSFSKDGRNYRYSWSGLTDLTYITYRLECTGGTQQSGSGGNNNGAVSLENGYVLLEPTGSTLTCKIINGSGEVVTQDTVSLNANSTQAQTSAQTTTAPSTTQTPKSNNNNLSSLNITGDDGDEVVLSPSFSSSVYTYEATVASTVRTVSIDATLEDSKANMVISNNADEELVAGENNRITITVTAEDGSKRAYTINIAREALTADATLKELTIKEVKSFKLEDDKFTYNIKIKKGVKELTIDYALSDENAGVEIDGNENLKDGSKVKITVTAEDGTKKVYTLNISVEDEDTKTDTSSISVEKNPLIIMGLSIIAFGLIGGIIYVIKK